MTDRSKPTPVCPECNGDREISFSAQWRSVPCPTCRPDEFRALAASGSDLNEGVAPLLEHDGGPCPVDADALIGACQMDDGRVGTGPPMKARYIAWGSVKRYQLLAALRSTSSSTLTPDAAWYCPKCDAEVDPQTVTYDERHELCGTPVCGTPDTATPAIRDQAFGEADVERVARALAAFEYERDNGRPMPADFTGPDYQWQDWSHEARVAIRALKSTGGES